MIPFVAGAAALVFAGYHTMGPRSQLYGRTFVGERKGSRRLALTFDDGPSDPHTLNLLDVLARHQVRATFFMIGTHAARHPQIARAVAAAGHAIGNHTQTHPLLTLKSRSVVRAEIQACCRVLEDTIGEHSTLFRPPYGGRRPAVLREVRAQGLVPILWSVAAYDWRTQSPSRIEANVCNPLRGGEIILLHDGAPVSDVDRAGTVEATSRLIPRLQQEGYEFVTVLEMLQSQESAPSAGS